MKYKIRSFEKRFILMRENALSHVLRYNYRVYKINEKIKNLDPYSSDLNPIKNIL